jgi:hypothetical protein
MRRRAFLAVAGTAAVASFGIDRAEAGSSEPEGTSSAKVSSTATQVRSTSQRGTGACPRGLVNDPYPGKCHHCVDTTGDGFCAYPVLM